MAKDYTGVRPLGIVTRHPADWFDDLLYTGGYVQPFISPLVSPRYVAVGLANDDDQGRVAKVYGVTVQSDAGESYGLFFSKDKSGAPIGAANPIRPDNPAVNIEVSQATTIYVTG